MKMQYSVLLAIAIFQACSTVPTTEFGAVGTIEHSAKLVCVHEGKKVYRWTDEKGDVYYGDKPPPESNDRPESKDEGSADSVVVRDCIWP